MPTGISAARHSVKTAAHLVSRFTGSLSSRPPTQTEEAWVLSLLNPGEVGIWQQMSPADQRHAVAVAHDVSRRLTEAEEAAMASGWFTDLAEFARAATVAALLHDCGKVVSDLGTFARAGATVLWAAAPSDTVPKWSKKSGSRRRLADYRSHPAIGAELLVAAGSDRLVHTWAGEHHRSPQTWTVPTEVGRLLKECDDD